MTMYSKPDTGNIRLDYCPSAKIEMRLSQTDPPYPRGCICIALKRDHTVASPTELKSYGKKN